MINTTQQFLRKTGFDRVGVHFLLAVSGGADSIALFHVFLGLARRRGYRLTVAHLDHGLRGAAGRADAQFVASLCRAAGIPCVLGRADVRRRARRERVSLEMAARDGRYRFLAQIRARIGADAVVTAHTANDQAETVLLKLLRGAGPAGLAGIAPQTMLNGTPILHPLLTVTRKEIESFLKRQGQPWREDATNRDRQFRRNRVRHDLIPLLEQQFNPQIGRVLCETADRLRSEENAMAEWAEREYRRCRGAGETLDVALLKQQPVALRRRILILWLTDRRGDLRRLTHAVITRLADQVIRASGTGRRWRVAGLELQAQNGRLVVVGAAEKSQTGLDEAAVVQLLIPGKTRVHAAGLCVTALMKKGFMKSTAAGVGSYPARAVIRSPGRSPLFWRGWQAGDRMTVRGVGHRKLQDVFTDLKIPRADRARVRVLATQDEIVWLPGYRVARDWEVTDPEAVNLWLTVV
jgi:tRNA(Ile)-lysidine synthase